ncbi:hypothetical protein CsatB_018369 [Cannabis sativa]
MVVLFLIGLHFSCFRLLGGCPKVASDKGFNLRKHESWVEGGRRPVKKKSMVSFA